MLSCPYPCRVQKESRREHQMGEYAFLICTSARDSRCGCRCALGAAEYHSSPFDALVAIPFAHGTFRVMRASGATRMGLILPWCGAIAACWQLQKSPHESPPEGGASIRPHDRKHPLSWVPKRQVVPCDLRPSEFEHSRALHAPGGTFKSHFSPFY